VSRNLKAWHKLTIRDEAVNLSDGIALPELGEPLLFVGGVEVRLPSRARTLLIGYDAPSVSWPSTSGGDLLFDVRLRGDGIVYRRLFNLERWRTVQLACEPFTDAQIFVTDKTSAPPGSGLKARVVASDGAAHPGLVERVRYGQTIVAANDQITPYGAQTLTPKAADGLFRWNLSGDFITAPLLAGSARPILGTSFNASAPNFYVWDITL